MITHWIAIACLVAAGDTPPAEGSKDIGIDPLSAELYSTDSASPAKPSSTTPPTSKPPTTRTGKPLELEVAVQLVEGKQARVMDLARSVFREGDHIQLKLKSPSSGYAAVAQVGSDGTASLLFPAPEFGLTTSRILAGAEVLLPSKEGSFVFDAQPGTETLVLLLSRDEALITDLVQDFTRAKLDAWMLRERPAEGSKNLRTVRNTGEVVLQQTEGTALIHVVKLQHM